MSALGSNKRGNDASTSGASWARVTDNTSQRASQRASQASGHPRQYPPTSMPHPAAGQVGSQPNDMSSMRSSQMQGSRARSRSASAYRSQEVSTYDGPGSQGSQDGSDRGRRMSTEASGRTSSRGSSVTRSGFPILPAKVEIGRLLDVGSEAYLLQNEYDAPKTNMTRPGFAGGKDIALRINSHRVLAYPSNLVYQYDVVIGNGDEKRAVNNLVWNSQAAKKAIGAGWIYDGAKLAWSNRTLGQCTIHVDLDAEKGREPNPKRSNKFRMQIKQTKTIGLQGLMAYMNNKADFTVECLEAINFLDHLMREIPSRRLYAIKRSFFDKSMKDAASLGQGVVAVKGVYQSIRPAMGGLVVNADIANQVFWNDSTLYTAILDLALPTGEHQVMINMQKKNGVDTMMYRSIQRLKKVRFTVSYRGMPERLKNKTFVVDQILRTNARDTTFNYTDHKTGEEYPVSVNDYFLKQYNVYLESPNMPIIQATGKNSPKYPPEFCNIVKGQKYPFKLNEVQTSCMIKFAVTRPQQRQTAIGQVRQMLGWDTDPAMKMYGLQINNDMLQTKAKLLQPPKVEFAGGKAENPGTSGRWRIDGKQFVQPNPEVLNVWTCCVFNDWTSNPRDKVNKAEVDRFLNEFQKLFKAYGGRLGKAMPAVIDQGNVLDIPNTVKNHWEKTKAITKGLEPQLMLFIVNAKNASHYNRLKRQCDNRYGCVSQVMQSTHIKKCQGQYIGNVLLKVFAKLGGFGFRASPASGKLGTPFNWFTVPTIIVGADVSHGAAGSNAASIASVTVSMDRIGARYWAMVQSNGRREEMITTWNAYDMLVPAFRQWMATVGGGRFPAHLIYFRDGVSEGQYQHVLQREVRDMKAIWEGLDQSPGHAQSANLKFTVVVASKRHHIRFFPGPGVADKNGNAQPGTLVERDVTHPREYDFYLCSHSAIQGTARPVHYHVLMDEAKMPVDKFVNLVYNFSYQYARSTTPVSIFPAIYYAHLAAKRAVAHDRAFGEDAREFRYNTSDRLQMEELTHAKLMCDRTGKIMTQNARKRLAELERMETPILLPLGPPPNVPKEGSQEPPAQLDPRKFRWSMWYI